MASALQQDWENYNPNNQTALRSPNYWDAVKENIPYALSGIKRIPPNWLGFPADIYSAAGYGADRLSAHPELQQEYMNMMFNDPSLRPHENVRREELVSDKPMFTNKAPLGSEWIAEKMGLPERTGHPTELGVEISGELALPFLGKSALSALKIVKDKLPEFVGKNVPELFKTPITGLNIKPKDSALSPNLTKEDKIARGIESQRELLPKYLYHTPRGRNVDDGIKTYKHKEFDEIGRDGKGIYLSQEPYDSNSVKIDVSKIPMRHRKDVDFTGQQEGYIVSKIDIPKEAIVPKSVGTHQWKIKHKENDGVFYRAEHEDGSGTKHGMLGSGRYFSNSEKDANIFMDEGKILSKYKIKEDLNLASAKQVDDISEEVFGMSIHDAPYGNPEFAEALTNVIKLKGFDGVYTDHNIMGTVIFDPRNYQKIHPVTGKLIKSKLTKIYKKPK